MTETEGDVKIAALTDVTAEAKKITVIIKTFSTEEKITHEVFSLLFGMTSYMLEEEKLPLWKPRSGLQRRPENTLSGL